MVKNVSVDAVISILISTIPTKNFLLVDADVRIERVLGENRIHIVENDNRMTQVAVEPRVLGATSL